MFSVIPRSLFLTLIFLSLFSTVCGLCSKEEFQCDTNKCFGILVRCDGKMNCDDYSDELHCNVTETMRNATNFTMSANNTSPQATPPGNLTISQPTPLNNHSKITKPFFIKKHKEDKYKKNMRTRVYFDNNTKRRKKHPFLHKPSASSLKEASTEATDKITSDEKKTKNVEASPVTPCSVEECAKWKSCWRDVKRSHECDCDEAACRRDWKASAKAGNESDRKMKDVFEWVIISISSTALIVAIIVLLLKRRRLHQNKVNVHTVVCYHHGQVESACLGRNVITRGSQGKGAAESRPLCDKAGYPSPSARDERNVCYIDFTGEVKRNK